MSKTKDLEDNLLKELDGVARYNALKLMLHPRCPSHIEFEDALQEARIAILEAVRSFNPSKGASLSTWAFKCSKQRLGKILRSASRAKRNGLTVSLDEFHVL